MKRTIKMMKIKNTIFVSIIMSLILVCLFTSCQEEETDVVSQNQEQILDANSSLANLMRNAVTFDGSASNIIDNANCLSIQLPVTVIVNGVEIIIDSEEDYEVVESIFDELDDDDDNIEIIFPIIITIDDYSEIVINNYEELEAFIAECSGENEDDDDIECIDFQYPLTFSIYDSNFQIIDTVVVENDEALYNFIDGLEGGVLASLNFPVNMILADGSIIEVNNNVELEETISAAEDDCDEDDDYDWDDDDNDCTEEEVNMYLQECHWVLASHSELSTPNQDSFGFELFFADNGILETLDTENNTSEVGTWSTSTTDQGIVLHIEGLTESGEIFAGSWLIIDCEDNRFELIQDTAANQVAMVIERECEDDLDCNTQQIIENLTDCIWYSGTGLLGNDLNGPYTFTADGTVLVASSNGTALSGSWNIELTDAGLFLVLEMPVPYEAISLEWQIVECDEDRLEMVHGDHSLVLEQDCNTSNPFECFENTVLTACDYDGDGFAEFDLEYVYPNCSQDDVEVHYYINAADAENQTNPLSSPYTNVSNPQVIYARVQLAGTTTTFEIFGVELIVEDCSSDCTDTQVAGYLQECVWNVVNFNGSNDLIEYDFDFNSNGIVVIYTDNITIDAMWSTSQNATGGVWLEISEIDGTNVLGVSGNWLVVDCDADRLELHRDNDFMVMEQDCTVDTNPFDCFVNAPDQLVDTCIDSYYEVATFDLTTAYADCLDSTLHTVSYYTTQQDAENDVNPIANPSEFNIDAPYENMVVYVRVELNDGTGFEVFEIHLFVGNCGDTCGLDNLYNYLMECNWQGNNNAVGYTFSFNDNNSLTIEGNGESQTGYWSLSSETISSTGATFSFLNILNFGTNFQIFEGEYQITSCTPEIIEVTGDGAAFSVLERDCSSNNNPFECFEMVTVTECDDDGDGVTQFDLDTIYADCLNNDLEVRYYETFADASGGTNQLISPYVNTVANYQIIYARVEVIGGTSFEIFEVHLVVEDCSTPCTEQDVDGFLLECHWNVVNYNGTDSLLAYDFDFNDDGTVVITGNGQAITAMWSTTSNSDGVWVQFENVTASYLQAISGNWLIVDCASDRLEMQTTNDAMVMEQTCP